MGCSVVVLVIISPLANALLQKLNEPPAVFYLQPYTQKYLSTEQPVSAELSYPYLKTFIYFITTETDRLGFSPLLLLMGLTH